MTVLNRRCRRCGRYVIVEDNAEREMSPEELGRFADLTWIPTMPTCATCRAAEIEEIKAYCASMNERMQARLREQNERCDRCGLMVYRTFEDAVHFRGRMCAECAEAVKRGADEDRARRAAAERARKPHTLRQAMSGIERSMPKGDRDDDATTWQ